MKRTGYGLRMLAVCGVVSAFLIAAGAAPKTPPPVTATAPAVAKHSGVAPESAAAALQEGAGDGQRLAEARELCQAGISAALVGQFDEALASLNKATGLAPNDRVVPVARRLVKEHMVRFNRSRREQTDEYNKAVRRVEYCMLAQKHLTVLSEAGVEKKLRDKTQEILSKYEAIGTADSLLVSNEDAAAKLKAKAVKSADEAAAAVPAVLKLLKDDDSEYATAFRGNAEGLIRCLTACKEAWAAAEVGSADARATAAEKLKDLQDDVADAMANMEMMTHKKPWQIALSQARLAAQLAPDTDKLLREQWYRSLVADAEQRGLEAVRTADWNDALGVYAGLDNLVENTETYKDRLKAARGHVRVLRLYGDGNVNGENGESAESPTTAPAPAETITWKDHVAGVDAEMIRAAISRVHGSYVTPVDYRKVTRGALRSIRVLAETPQAGRSFPKLTDEKMRTQFLAAVQREVDYVEKKDRIDHVELTYALNNILEASDRTVQIPTAVLAVEFADGFLAELDRFSSMIWPNDVNEFRKQTMGQFYGIGVQITKDPGESLRVVTPLADTPAYRAGIKTNDVILKVDGVSTKHHAVDKLVRRITGEKGTKVVLTIQRAGVPKPFAVSIIRAEINIRTVKGWRRLPAGEWDYMIDPDAKIGYIRMTQFTDTTPGDIAAALTALKNDGMQALVLDLRFNPGGLLRAATKVVDEFLLAGRIVSTRGRQVRETEVNADSGGAYLKGNLAVLINEHSASAAEIVSGALKDWKRCIVVGHRSFGKGSVQNVIPIRPKRAFLKLTTAYYYLPSGRLLHKRNGQKDWGVDPHVQVRITPMQMKRWLEMRRKTDLLTDVPEEKLVEDLIKQYDADLQLSTAVLLLRLKRLNESKPAA